MNDGLTDVLVAVSFGAACWCGGGLNGLYLAWSQPARMRHWAARVERVQLAINEWEDRADGVSTDLGRGGGGVAADGSSAAAEPARGPGLGLSDVPGRATSAVLEQGSRSSSLTGWAD